ncbi:hypothetical protein [Clostridium sp. FS41]|uniref:hypothetical protein n=1 Tax=Clostridium sp. FS41 TaxID=1609975 RepID=UPI0005D36C45|nr:hypothetical protein [Clostridium sp. FS41]KJJ65429.1 hypothetical protein CLFS41_56930 [Clostridium sp. FS41]
MKKIVVLLILCLFVVGCSKAEVQEFSVNELSRLYNNVELEVASALDEMTEKEIYGGEVSDEKRNEQYWNTYRKIQNEKVKTYNIKTNSPIYVSGIFHPVGEANSGKLLFNLEDDEGNSIPCESSNKEFLDIKDGTEVRIKGIFFSKDRRGAYISECEIVK